MKKGVRKEKCARMCTYIHCDTHARTMHTRTAAEREEGRKERERETGKREGEKKGEKESKAALFASARATVDARPGATHENTLSLVREAREHDTRTQTHSIGIAMGIIKERKNRREKKDDFKRQRERKRYSIPDRITQRAFRFFFRAAFHADWRAYQRAAQATQPPRIDNPRYVRAQTSLSPEITGDEQH